MNISTAILVLALVVGAGAETLEPMPATLPMRLTTPPPTTPSPVPPTPRCSTVCPVTNIQKLNYLLNTAYSYEYFGSSKVQVTSLEGGTSATDWSYLVNVTWVSPCDMAIFMQEAKVDGATGPPAAKFLEKYPLVVALTDGRVHHVCTHPDDDVWSINIKKGIASAFQNSLPSLSSISSGLNFIETDVVGKCATKYFLESEGDRVIVKKEKNHRLCKERYPTPAETQVPWLKGPLPLEESKSLCKQEITNGIYSSIICEDKNVVRPSYGAYKYVEAKQESTLRYVSLSSQQPPVIPQGSLVRKSLRYSYQTLNKDPSMVAELDQTMTQICEKTKDVVERDAAALVAKAVQLLRRVPDKAVEQILVKIRSGHYCQDYLKLENLFLDLISFVQESGAVKVMVKELLIREATGVRAALYTAAFFFLPRPNTYAVESIKPLIQSQRYMPTTTLAASTMVNTYCRQNLNCRNDAPVINLVEALGNKIHSQCSPFGGKQTQKAALVTLKALGNMGVVTREVARSVLRCVETEGVKTNVRVAAVQAFRQVECQQNTTQKLINISLNSSMDTEIRIAAYLTIIRCVGPSDIVEIVTKISEEENTQVRGYILSHLTNVQGSYDPVKDTIKHLLPKNGLPTDFKVDFRKYSRNIDMSYFAPSLGVGAGVESNIIYVPGSFVPRSVDFKLTAALEGIFMNLGEFGARIEGLDSIIRRVYGPKGYFRKNNFGKIFKDVIDFAVQGGKKINEYFPNSQQANTSCNYSFVSNLLDQLHIGQSDDVEADVFARYMDQEIVSASLSGNTMNSSADTMYQTFFSYFQDTLRELKNLHFNSARTGQVNFDYSFPTIQGTPLKLMLEGTIVAGLKMEGNFNLVNLLSNWRTGEHLIRINPGLSFQAHCFIGYDNYLIQTGIRMNNTVFSSTDVSLVIKVKNNNDFEIHLDFPEDKELLHAQSETYLMKSVRGSPDTKIATPSMRDVRFTHRSCSSRLESMLDVIICYDVDVPDIFRSSALPLGAPSIFRLYMKKPAPYINGYLIKVRIRNNNQSNMLTLKATTTGSDNPSELQATFTHTMQNNSQLFSTTVSSPAFTSGVWFTIVNQQDYRSVETYVRFASNETELSRGIKVNLKTISTPNEKGSEVHVYSSRNRIFPQESDMAECKYLYKVFGPRISLDIVSKTKNLLREYLDLNFDLGTDLLYLQNSGLPRLTKLRKLEFQSVLGSWQVVSFIRQTRETNDTAEHASAFKLTHRNQDLFSVQATQSIEGQLDQNFVVSASAKVLIRAEEYKTSYMLKNENFHYGGSIQIYRSKDNKLVMDLEAFIDRAHQQYTTKLLIDIPGFIRPIKLSSKVVEHQPHHYMTHVAFMQADHILFHLEGPITVLFTSTITKLQGDVQANSLTSRPYNIGFVFISSQNEEVLSFDLQIRREPIIYAAWIMRSTITNGTSIEVKFALPTLVTLKIYAGVNDEHLHLAYDNLMLPNSSSARQVKLAAEVNMEQKEGKVDFLWDADNDRSKKISMNVTTVTSSSHPDKSSIHVKAMYFNESYHINLDLVRPDLRVHFYGEHSLDLEVILPSQKNFTLGVNTDIQLHAAITVADSHILYKSLENKQYRLRNVIEMENLGSPNSFKFVVHQKFINSEGHETTLSTEVKHHKTPEQRLIYLKALASTPFVTKPLRVDLLTVTKENSCTAKITADEGPASAILFTWNLEVYPEGGAKNLTSAVYLKDIRDFLKAILQLAGLEKEENIVMLTEQRERTKYGIHYHKPTPTTYTMRVEYPTRTIEGEAIYSPSEASVKVYPNKRESNAKYELTGRSSHTYWDQESKFEGHISHPSLTRDMRVEVQYSVTGENMRGTIELDIFPDTADKITGTFESIQHAPGSIKTKVYITTRALKVNPNITLATAYSSDKIGFDFEFQKNLTSPVSYSVFAIYDQTYGYVTTMAFNMLVSGVTSVDLIGQQKDEDNEGCYGTVFNGVVRTYLLGNFNIRCRVCDPAFVEFTSFSQETGEGFSIRLGLQEPNNLEFSISTGDEQLNDVVAKARLSLTSPTKVNVEFIYETPKVCRVKAILGREMHKVTSAIMSWFDEIYHTLQEEAQEQGLIFPAPELLIVIHEVNGDLKRIYNDLLYGPLMHVYEAVHLFLESNSVVTYLSQQATRLWSAMVHVEREVRNSVLKEILAWQRYFRGIKDRIIAVVVGIAQMLESGEVPEVLRRMFFAWQQTKFFRVVSKDVSDLFAGHPEELQAMKHVASKVQVALQQDLERIRLRFIDIPSVRKITQWILINVNRGQSLVNKLDDYISDFIANTIFVSVHTGKYFVRGQIPLSKPSRSITHVLQRLAPDPIPILRSLLWLDNSNIYFSTNDLIWAYYTLLPLRLTDHLPPYNRTAMVISGTEILTFDGTHLRVPRSPCKVILATYTSNRVIMSHPDPSHAIQVTFINPHTNVTIKPDSTVEINGHKMTKPQETDGEVTVQKTPDKVKVISPFMTIQLTGDDKAVFVEVSGWTFDLIAGLLGTYDGEIQTDWLMPSGTMAESYEELVTAWQEDGQCPTPTLVPVAHNLFRVAECNMILDTQKICFPLVHREPFIKLCSATRQVCEAAYAYGSLCSNIGIDVVLPSGC